MKKFLSRMFNGNAKRAIVSLVAVAGIVFPAVVLAAGNATIAATTEVANVTSGVDYQSSVNASYDQVVKVQVIYTNTEASNSGLVADNVHIKINSPSTTGVNQAITTDTAGDNTNDVTGQASVILSDQTAYLQYIPGSTVAEVTATNGTVSEYNVPDSQSALTSLNSAGYLVDNGDPCQSASVTVLERVMIPGVKIVKQSEVLGQNNAWSADNTANPGDTLKYLITYTNSGNTVENNVIIGDNLPPKLQLVPNTTVIYNANFPNGTPDKSNNVASGGINIGNYTPGSDAYVEFEVTIPQASGLSCGVNEFRNVGVAQPQGVDAYYNTAITDVTNQCPTTTPPTTTTPPASTPPVTTSSQLINTGPGDDIAGIFAGTSVFGAVAHRFYKVRNFLRRK